MTETGRGAVVFGLDGPGLGRDEAAFFREADPLGFILFARNVDTPDRLHRLTSDLRASVGRDAPVFVDQEGGRVQRLRAPHWAEWLPPLDAVMRAGAGAARMLWLRGRLIAAELRAVGIDANCAPTLDLVTPATHAFLRNRCLGSDPGTVAALGRALARGLMAGGVIPVVKHMPGHGRADADTHLNLPTVDTDIETLESTDFAPFAALADLPAAMTAHVVFSAVDDRPATCSASVIRLIRERIGFGGLLLSDDLGMEALTGSLPERAAAARAAGCDIALHCKGTLAERAAVAEAAGVMSDETRACAALALALRREGEPADLPALRAEHERLMRAMADG